MATDQPSKSEIISTAQALLKQDDREQAETSQSSPRKFLLLKLPFFRPRPNRTHAKASIIREVFVLIAAAVVAVAILVVLLAHIRHD